MVKQYNDLIESIVREKCMECANFKPVKGGVEFKFGFVCKDCLKNDYKEYANE